MFLARLQNFVKYRQDTEIDFRHFSQAGTTCHFTYSILTGLVKQIDKIRDRILAPTFFSSNAKLLLFVPTTIIIVQYSSSLFNTILHHARHTDKTKGRIPLSYSKSVHLFCFNFTFCNNCFFRLISCCQPISYPFHMSLFVKVIDCQWNNTNQENDTW